MYTKDDVLEVTRSLGIPDDKVNFSYEDENGGTYRTLIDLLMATEYSFSKLWESMELATNKDLKYKLYCEAITELADSTERSFDETAKTLPYGGNQ